MLFHTIHNCAFSLKMYLCFKKNSYLGNCSDYYRIALWTLPFCMLFLQTAKFSNNPFTWTGDDNVGTGVVKFDIRTDYVTEDVLTVSNLRTPIDVYLPADTAPQADQSHLTRVLVTSGATSLVGLQTGGGTNMAVKVALFMNEYSGK